MHDLHRLIETVFRSHEWRRALDAWYEAIGVSVLVVDAAGAAAVSSGPRAGYCGATEGVGGPGGPGCITVDGTAACAGGTPCRVLPLILEDEIVARLVVCGFVTSAEERRGLHDRLCAAGLPEAEVRAIVRGVPVIPKRRLPAIESMVLNQASALLERQAVTRTALADGALLGAFVDTIAYEGPQGADPELIPTWLLTHAMRLLGGTKGCLAVIDPDDGELRVIAEEGSPCETEQEALRRTNLSGRSALVSLPASRAAGEVSLCVPLRIEERRIGAMCVAVPDAHAGRRLSAFEQFAFFASVTLDTLLDRRRREREVYELMQLSEVARMLHQGVETGDIGPLVANLLEKALEFSVGGVAFTGYGTERAVAVVKGEVAEREVRAVAEEATGRPESASEIQVLAPMGLVTDEVPADREWSVMSVPLFAGGTVLGYLFAARVSPQRFDADDERLVERFAAHVAVAFNRSALFDRLLEDYTRTLHLLSAALDAGEGMESGHTGRVMELSMRIGETLGLPPDDIELLRFAGLVHDVGKIGVSDTLLLKPARLSEEEMAQVRRHSQIGATLIEQVDFLNAVAPVVLHHHERWDGTGYPMRLTGEAIPLLSRVLAIADAYAAMTSATPYRPALTPQQAEAEIVSCAGTQFDPAVVKAFVGSLREMEQAGLTGLFGQGGQDALPA